MLHGLESVSDSLNSSMAVSIPDREADLALPEQRQSLRLEELNERGEIDGQDSFGEVHSFCTNLHKSGVGHSSLSLLRVPTEVLCQLVAFDCSCLFVRDSKLLTEVLDVTPPFLRNHSNAGQVTDYRNWGLTLGRRFRSLKIFFVLRSFGVEGFQKHLRRSIELAELLEKEIEKDKKRFELVTPRSLALVVFRLQLEGKSEEELDQLNRKLYATLHKKTAIQLSECVH